MNRFVGYLPHSIEAEDVVGYGACPPRLRFVFVAQQTKSGQPPSVVQLPMCEHSKQRGLARIDVAHDRDTDTRGQRMDISIIIIKTNSENLRAVLTAERERESHEISITEF